MGRPTLYLTHVSVRRPGFVGPGRKWTIMALPRRWERQEGDVRALLPSPAALRAVKDGTMTESAYFDQYNASLRGLCTSFPSMLEPGHLSAFEYIKHLPGVLVSDGDTLTCGGSCSIEHAREGRCHRTHAAPFLVRAGWRVILDGVEVAGG